jgi:hypothetical protein
MVEAWLPVPTNSLNRHSTVKAKKRKQKSAIIGHGT